MDLSPHESIPSNNLAAFHQQVTSEVELQNITRVDISQESPSLLAAMALLESAKQILERRPEIAEAFSAHSTPRRAEVKVTTPDISADKEIVEKKKSKEWESVRNTLMVVASLIVTVTFQAALIPLGGVWQEWPDKQTKSFAVKETNSIAPPPYDYKPGEAIGTISYPNCLQNFLTIDALGFVSSLWVMFIILFFMICPPKRMKPLFAGFQKVLKWALGLLLLEAIAFVFATFWLGMDCLFPSVELFKIGVAVVALSFCTFFFFIIFYVVITRIIKTRAKAAEERAKEGAKQALEEGSV